LVSGDDAKLAESFGRRAAVLVTERHGAQAWDGLPRLNQGSVAVGDAAACRDQPGRGGGELLERAVAGDESGTRD
jgi:hypothetical protein